MDTPNQSTIRVMIVDDHAVVRSGLAAFLSVYEELKLVGEAADGEEALRVCEYVRPDVIVMNMLMPRMDGAAATEAIRERHPHIQIIILSSSQEGEVVQRGLEAGAIGYLLKNVSGDDLATAIRSAYAGKPTLAPEATQAIIHRATHLHEMNLGDNLTKREREVLQLMIEGLNNVEIAKQMIVSRSTSKFHVSNILSKLNARSRAQAVGVAVRHKLVE